MPSSIAQAKEASQILEKMNREDNFWIPQELSLHSMTSLNTDPEKSRDVMEKVEHYPYINRRDWVRIEIT